MEENQIDWTETLKASALDFFVMFAAMYLALWFFKRSNGTGA